MYRKDPEWTRKTFVEAASVLKIKPIQAYKWGYHKRMKESENKSEEEIEVKVIVQSIFIPHFIVEFGYYYSI